MKGILIINKPEGFTSQDVVSKVKKILNIKKAGHTGTLDPMATGVLPILLNEYTKLSKYLIEHDKTYIAELVLGKKTDTGDREGNVLENTYLDSNILKKENIEKILSSFLGKQLQTPPIYSAIKVNGKKLYEYAREGKNIEIEPRKIEIYDIKLLSVNKENLKITFEVSCSKGTYIRVLCEDIAKKIGTIGYMENLTRIVVDKFKIETAITLEELEKNKDNLEFIEQKLIKMENVFQDLPRIDLPIKKKELFLNGVNLSYKLDDGLYNIYTDKTYLGTATIKNNLLKRDIII